MNAAVPELVWFTYDVTSFSSHGIHETSVTWAAQGHSPRRLPSAAAQLIHSSSELLRSQGWQDYGDGGDGRVLAEAGNRTRPRYPVWPAARGHHASLPPTHTLPWNPRDPPPSPFSHNYGAQRGCLGRHATLPRR